MFTQRFISRGEELEFLEKKCKKRPGLIVIYGRRRVGKTLLLEKFCEGKKSIYYTATETNKKEQLAEAFDLVYKHTKDEHLKELKHSWETLLRYLKDKQMIFIIDEFPYVIKADGSVPSQIQRIWDKELKSSNLFLILTGSSVSMMEDDVLSPKSPLYGRRTGQWKLEPFRFGDAVKFFPDFSVADKIRTYAVLGGIPYFLEQFEIDKGVFENINDNILNRGAVLHNEVEFLMREEFREPMNYFTILRSISQGNTTFSEIQNDTGISKNNLTSYLSILRNLHLVERRTPVTAKMSKKGRYYLQDNFFRFWFRYILPNKSQLETDREALLEEIKISLEEHVSFIFEDVCREVVNSKYRGYETGRWWYREDEIDLVAISKRENRILFGECKWSRKEAGPKVLKRLEEKSGQVRWGDKDRKEAFVIFSRSGFSKGLESIAKKRADVSLVGLRDFEDML